MHGHQIMTREMTTVLADKSILYPANLMLQQRISGLPFVDATRPPDWRGLGRYYCSASLFSKSPRASIAITGSCGVGASSCAPSGTRQPGRRRRLHLNNASRSHGDGPVDSANCVCGRIGRHRRLFARACRWGWRPRSWQCLCLST